MSEYLPVGSSIGILGGGQLGRMLVLAAAPLGYKCHIYCPESDAPATHNAYRISHAPYEDHRQLLRFSDNVDVVTYEFENIPVATARFLEQRRRILPGPLALEVAQDRFMEKSYLTRLEVPTAPFQAFYTLDQLTAAAKVIGLPAIAKTRRLGYDGKGQVKINSEDQLEEAWESFGDSRAILEGFIDFKKEISVLVARSIDGNIAFYPVAENVHRNHILAETIAPANISDEVAEQAHKLAGTIAEALDYTGILAVEMFVTQDDELLVNEIAPRVHNSGHWTIEGAKTSQFEQHIRCICGLPLGSTELVGPSRMENLIGDDVERRMGLLEDTRAHLHLYGKMDVRDGRKMGHVTWVEESEDG